MNHPVRTFFSNVRVQKCEVKDEPYYVDLYLFRFCLISLQISRRLQGLQILVTMFVGRK